MNRSTTANKHTPATNEYLVELYDNYVKDHDRKRLQKEVLASGKMGKRTFERYFRWMLDLIDRRDGSPQERLEYRFQQLEEMFERNKNGPLGFKVLKYLCQLEGIEPIRGSKYASFDFNNVALVLIDPDVDDSSNTNDGHNDSHDDKQ